MRDSRRTCHIKIFTVEPEDLQLSVILNSKFNLRMTFTRMSIIKAQQDLGSRLLKRLTSANVEIEFQVSLTN